MTRRVTPYLLSAPAAGLLVGLLAVPLALLVRVSLYEPARGRGFYAPGTWTEANYAALADRHGASLVGFTVLFGAAVAVLSVAVAFPCALAIRRLPAWGRRVAVAAVLLPKLSGALVTLFGLQYLLSGAGPVSGLLVAVGGIGEPLPLNRSAVGAAVGEAYLIVPYLVVVLFVRLLRIDPAVEAAARGLGASRRQVFVRVTLPLSAPGLVLAGQLGLVWGLGAFLGPLFLGGPGETTLSVEVHRQAFDYGRWPRAAADAVAVLVVCATTLIVFTTATRRWATL